MMKRALLASLAILLACSGAAIAGKNGGGAMLLHTNDAVNYSAGWDNCANPMQPLPTDCAGIVTQTTHEVETTEAMIWMLGVFDPSASPVVTAWQFGIEHNLPSGYFTGFGPCGPGVLEIPDDTWPDQSGTGTACAAGSPITPEPGSSTMPLYWFAPIGVTGGFISTTNYPHGDPPVAQFADDSNPPQADNVTNFGTVRWNAEGSKSCPTAPLQGACCLPTAYCAVMLSSDCVSQNGTYLGDETACDVDHRCSACCFLNDQGQPRCVVTTESLCTALPGGSWSGTSSSFPEGKGFMCAPVADSSAVEWWCGNTPTRSTSWGHLRSLFR